jgi:hypothetical protein
MNSKNKSDKSLNAIITNARNLTENLRGVYLDVTALRMNKAKVFRALITVNNEKHSLGYHADVNEAAKAYNKAAKKLFGSEKKAKAAGRWNVIM